MAKICLSIAETSPSKIWSAIKADRASIEMVELRIDLIENKNEEEIETLIKKIKAEGLEVIWTVRWKEESGNFKESESERLNWLKKGDALGVDWLDIEYKSNLSKGFQPKNAKLILSYHNFKEVDDHPNEIVQKIALEKCDLVKVAFATKSTKDVRLVCELYSQIKKPLVAIAMGEFGECSRILPAVLGLPWTYASSADKMTAPGQTSAFALKNLYRFDQINEKTKVYTVIGDPIKHSLSPYLHNSHYGDLGLNAVYAKIHIDDMTEFYKLAKILKIKGASVTVPHKETLLIHSKPEHWLSHVGAANTLIQKDSKWDIENTDIAAAIESIKSVLQVTQPKVLLLGAGGVGKGLAWGMSREGWKLTICNRSIDKSAALCEQTNAELLAWEDRDAHGFDVVVNCTVLGMEPKEDATALKFFGSHGGLVAFDTVYTPENTLFLKLARETGATAISGREMFYRQAALQHAVWFNTTAPFEAMENIMTKLSEL